MSKCKECQINNCSHCENQECRCTCNRTSCDLILKITGIIGGIIAFVIGIWASLVSGGIFFGAILSSIGSSAVVTPISAEISGKQVSGGDMVKDMAIGAVVGAATAGIGAGGGAAATKAADWTAKVAATNLPYKKGCAKFLVRTAAGAVTGVVNGAVEEAQSNEKFNGKNFLTNVGVGALSGGLMHTSSNLMKAKCVADGVTRSAAKVAISAGSATLVTAADSVGRRKEINGQQILVSSVSAGVFSTVAEVTTNSVYKAYGGKDRLIEKRRLKEGKRKLKTENEMTILEDVSKDLNREKDSYIEKDIKSAETVDARKQKIQTEMNELNKQRDEQRRLKKSATGQEKVRIASEIKTIGTKIETLSKEKKSIVPKRDNYCHALERERIGQFSAAITEPNGPNPGKKRIVFDSYLPKGEKNLRCVYCDFIDDHDYKKLPKFGEARESEINTMRMARRCIESVCMQNTCNIKESDDKTEDDDSNVKKNK